MRARLLIVKYRFVLHPGARSDNKGCYMPHNETQNSGHLLKSEAGRNDGASGLKSWITRARRLAPFRHAGGRLILFLTGLTSLVWFLIRVIPKPSRATYPCQRAAAPMASSFVIWLAGLLGLAWARRRQHAWPQRFGLVGLVVLSGIALVAALLVVIALPHSLVQANVATTTGPIGVGKGIYPGRVVWVHAPEATSWAGETSADYWWQTNHTDLALVEPMFSQAIQRLAGEPTDAAAWASLFHHFNQTHGQGARGYLPGEKIAVKINLTTCNARSGSSTVDPATGEKRASIMNTIDNSPQMILCLLRQLVYTVGARPEDVYVGDPTGQFPKFMWDMLHPEFPAVHYFDNSGRLGRMRTEFSTNKFFWSSPDAGPGQLQDYIPVPFAQAAYLIDFAVLKGHSVGITLCGKNFYGALLRCPDGYFRDAKGIDRGGTVNYLSMHDSAPGFGYQGMKQYRAIVDLLGHHDLGGKTMLFLVDGLFGGYYWDSHPYPWKMPPFGDGVNGNWPSSLFASQDPVAIDSVGYDFLLTEWPKVVTGGGGAMNSLNGSAEDYLHEAALAGEPPSHTHYNPDHSATGLASLGVHEHWNNAVDKQYSRNRGLNEGIELVSVHVDREPPSLAVSRQENQVLLSWSASQTGYTLEAASSLAPQAPWALVTNAPVFYQARNVVTNPATEGAAFYRLIK
jgi:hypothetical protein